MAKYTFHLETLQKVRRAHRDHQRCRLAEAYRAEELLEQRRTELAELRTDVRRHQRSAFSTTCADMYRLVAADRYLQMLKERQQLLDQQQASLAGEIEQLRQALMEADRQVRVLDLLDDHGRDAHLREQLQLERKQLDETAVQRACMGKR